MKDEACDRDQPAAPKNPAAESEVAASASEATAASEPAAGENLEQALGEAQEEIARMKDMVLRAQADVENVRRRAALDVEAAHKFALDKFVLGLLPIADSLEKSMEAVAGHDGGDEALSAIKEGIDLSARMFMDTLEKFGVKGVDPLGEPFDPERHEAISLIAAPDTEPNSVVTVLQKGYILNGRLLRAAMVVVAKSES